MGNIVYNFENNKENFGKKGDNLKILNELFKNNKKIIVPETIILTSSLFKKVINENGNIDFSKYENITINPHLTNDILKNIRSKFDHDNLVVRSSATCEDSIFFSGAGQYDSFLNIKEDEKIIEAIKKIYASLFNKNSNLYSKIYNINLKKESMAVLIQRVAPVIEAGVMFSCNPSTSEKKYIIQYTLGLGTDVVEGSGNINNIEIEYKNKKNIPNKKIKRLITIIDTIKKYFGYDVDIEWGIDKDDNIYIFQVRPIIFRNISLNIKYNSDIAAKKCIPISKGFCIGKITKITNSTAGTILYKNKRKYDFNDLELILNSKGVILEDNALLSHFANILRELVKPCVYINNFDFDENKLYIVDAFNGKIIDFENLNSKERADMLFQLFYYMKDILSNSYEKYNGIQNINEDDKYEQVIFDFDEKNIVELLKYNNFKKEIVNQGIYTYDFPDNALIKENTIFRIQVTNKKINVQLKKLDTNNEKYRKEKGIIINFDSLKKAKRFMLDYGTIETGYQERKIIKYTLDDICINLIKWPNCKPYIGLEVSKISQFDDVKDMLQLDNCLISNMNGKQIFEKLGLTLEDCKFNNRVKVVRK